MASATRDEFPCKLDLTIPFPTPHLASIALRALRVDKELSPLVQRTFSLASPPTSTSPLSKSSIASQSSDTVLKVLYRATTNRMLRVSVNGFFESLKLVVQVMEDLDVDIAMGEGREGVEKVQGLGEGAAGV